MSARGRATALAFGLAALCRPASAAELSLAVDAEALHAAMPFVLTLTAKGFDETPAPAPPSLAIVGCETTFLGVSPNVASRIQIINGRRSEWRDVSFVFRWRVLCAAAGRYQVPSLRVEQSATAAASRAASFEVTAVPASTDMIVRVRLPERVLWAGETFDAAVEWLLARDVSDYQFSVPLFNLPDAKARPPSASQASRTVRFAAGASDIELPLHRDEVRENGRRYTRFTFPVRVTLNRPGTWDVEPIQVVARLQTGTVRDAFGFPRPRQELFRAVDKRRQLVVRPLPQAKRPVSFAGAIGSGFAIELQASRTVVAVGDPIELTIHVRGDGPLTGLGLPPLAGPQMLPVEHFTVPDGSPAGVAGEDGSGKRFDVTVRVKSAEVREIPSIAFAYFDPAAGEYRIARSQPIALSVDAAQLVGVDDVVAAPKPAVPTGLAGDEPRPESSVATLHGADMSQSASTATFARPWGTHALGATLGALYGVPLLVALASFYLARTGGRRAQGQTMRRALAELERALASSAPAREAAPAIVAAMRRCGNAFGVDARTWSPSVERLETQAFDPSAADQAVSAEVVAELRAIARGWSKTPRSARARAAVLLALGAAIFATSGHADAEQDAVTQAREQYQAALAETDGLRRVRLFAKAEELLRQVAAQHPDAAQLQVDWGNAALGARDAGRAVLAYRRALRVDPGNERAGANLTWLRARQPVWLPRPVSAGALDSLLFWRGRFTAQQLHIIGAGAFAIAALLLAAWFRWRRGGLRAGTVALAVVWLACTVSALATTAETGAVVLEDGAVLRSADSVGAAPAFANPLPAGTEVQVLEDRSGWMRVALADGTKGWLPVSAARRVALDRRANNTPN